MLRSFNRRHPRRIRKIELWDRRKSRVRRGDGKKIDGGEEEETNDRSIAAKKEEDEFLFLFGRDASV